LQLKELKMSDLQAGRYPGGGDEDWAENLENGILSWPGSPSAPPVPDILAHRPPLGPLSAPPPGMASAPALGSSDWHQMFGGRKWRYDETGVYTMDFENGQQPWRTPGVPATCRKIVELCLDEILAAGEKHQVPPALIIMTIATETGFARNLGFTGPQTFRWEHHVEVTDVNPHLKGDYSAGPMQTATTARWIIRVQSLDYDPFQVAPVYEYRPEPPANHPLYDYAVNIDIGAAEIKQRWKKTGADPVLVAAAYNAGGLYEEEKNPWHLRCYGDHLNRAAQWFGDACAVLEELGV
jgi:peptidoglycan L-alanyl-D-glutamate endopeptidase CwlK